MKTYLTLVHATYSNSHDSKSLLIKKGSAVTSVRTLPLGPKLKAFSGVPNRRAVWSRYSSYCNVIKEAQSSESIHRLSYIITQQMLAVQ